MLISSINLKIEGGANGNFTFKKSKLYSDDQVPSWVVKNKVFKTAKKKEIITGEFKEKKQDLDKDLVKTAISLELNFDKDIESSALESLVANAEKDKKDMMDTLTAADVKFQTNSKPSTLKAKVDALKPKE